MADGRRHAVITSDDHGPVLGIISWVMMVSMIMMVALRLAIRFSSRNPGIDDALATLAMFMGIGSTIAISLAINNGLGRRDVVRDVSKTAAMYKNIFESSLLYVLAIWFAKLSTVILTARLCAKKSHRYIIWIILAITVGWGLAAVFADAFRCPLPHPWDLDNPQCINTYHFWNAISSLDILTDVILIGLPIYLFGSLQMRLSRKVIVFAAFGCRIFVVVSAVARLVYLNTTFKNSPPDSVQFNAIPYEICTQVQQSLAIMVASAPTLKSFIDRTTSGMMAVSLGGLTGTTFGKESYNMTNVSASHGSQAGSRKRSNRVDRAQGDATNISNTSHDSSGPSQPLPIRPNIFRGDQSQSSATVTSYTSQIKPSRSGASLRQPTGAAAPPPPLPHQRRNTNESASDGSMERMGLGSADGAARTYLDDASSERMIISVERDWKVEYHEA